jgi:hypothetical protein
VNVTVCAVRVDGLQLVGASVYNEKGRYVGGIHAPENHDVPPSFRDGIKKNLSQRT